MFKKLHRQMAFFCTLITGIILVSMSFICLYISENGIIQSSQAEFFSTITSIKSYLESQSTISQQWLSQMEGNGKYIIRLYDNGHDFLHNSINNTGDYENAVLLAKDQTAADYHFELTPAVISKRLTSQIQFSMENDDDRYYVSAMVIPKKGGYLSALVLYPQDTALQRIFIQRCLFAVVDLIAIVLLGIFAWIFTKHQIRPIEENKQRQTAFIAAASHELRSPLTVILSGISALKKAPVDQAPKFMNTIESEGQRMARLIDDMLTLAGADNGSWSLTLSDCDMDTLLLDVYEMYEKLARDKNITFLAELPEDPLPQIYCDSQRIMQVLSILIDNALSYVPRSGQIILSAAQNEHQLQLFVADNGYGIPDCDKEKIFDRFYRADQAHKDRQHFGLGLCIAKEILQLHHGSITVKDSNISDPKKNRGSKFIITLPISSAPKSNT